MVSGLKADNAAPATADLVASRGGFLPTRRPDPLSKGNLNCWVRSCLPKLLNFLDFYETSRLIRLIKSRLRVRPMLDACPLTHSADHLFGFDPDDPSAARHLFQVVHCLPGQVLRKLLDDIERAERGEVLSDEIGDVLERAACLADADRIFARLDNL